MTRKKPNIKLIAFDLDGTLITGNTWCRVNIAAGMTLDEDEVLYQAYNRQELTYADWIKKLNSFYQRGRRPTRADLEAALLTFELAPRVKEVIARLKTVYQTAIISGSFNLTAAAVGRTLDIKYTKACTDLEFNRDDEFVAIISRGEEKYAKLELFRELLATIAIKPEESLYVSDSLYDLPLIEATAGGIIINNDEAGVSTGLNPKIIIVKDWSNVEAAINELA